MKKATVENYKDDKFYPKIVRATAELLRDSDAISPVAILIRIGNLSPEKYDEWQHGKVPYLEKVFQGSLSKANRCLRIIGFHAHDLNMVPVHHTYRQVGKKRTLRFSKSNIPALENAYSRHFRWNQAPEKKQALIEQTLRTD